MGYRRIINPQIDAAGQQSTLHDLLILIQIRSRCPVITIHKTAHQRIGILIRIPHQFPDHISTHFREVCSFRTVHLRKMHRCVILLEQLDILLQDMEIRKARYHVVEVNAIIPHENIIGDSRPAFERLYKLTARGIIGQRYFPLAVDIAQHDVYIRQRLHLLGRMHGKEISQGRNLLIGEAFGQLVHETDIGTSRRTFFLVHLTAILTCTEGIVSVVLTD